MTGSTEYGFTEYSEEYFNYATTPRTICEDVLSTGNPAKLRILEIGSGKGHFAKDVLLSATEQEKKVCFVMVEFEAESRKELEKICTQYKKHPFNQSCVLGSCPNVIDYLHYKTANKQGFFSSIVSFYTLHCLCPSDFLETLVACHDFLQPKGTLWLTLQCSEAIDPTMKLEETLQELFEANDHFPGYNYDEERTKDRIKYFLTAKLPFPTKKEAVARDTYKDPHEFAHDIAPLLVTAYTEMCTRDILQVCGFMVEECVVVKDFYPSGPIEVGQFGNEGIETKYVRVKARKIAKPKDSTKLASYKEEAKKKEEQVFDLYQDLVFKK